jgi:hypothetical protein
MVHVLSCIVAYAFRPGKPSISTANISRLIPSRID